MIGWPRKFDVYNKYMQFVWSLNMAYTKFEHQISEGNLSHIGHETEGLY